MTSSSGSTRTSAPTPPVALGNDDEVLGELRVAADVRQISKLIRFAREWPDRIWAVENANVSDGCSPVSSSRRARP